MRQACLTEIGMKRLEFLRPVVALAAALVVASPAWATPTTHSFTQGGWFNTVTGAAVSGTLSFSFTGDDFGLGYMVGGASIGGSGISAFQLHWSGNAQIQPFDLLFDIFDPAHQTSLMGMSYWLGDADFARRGIVGANGYFGGGSSNGTGPGCDGATVLCGGLDYGNVSLRTYAAATSQTVPEPGTLLLASLGGLGLLSAGRKNAQRRWGGAQ